MKKTLQRELRVPSSSLDSDAEPPAAIIDPSSSKTVTAKNSSGQEEDVNFKYLKHVLIKFLTSREYEVNFDRISFPYFHSTSGTLNFFIVEFLRWIVLANLGLILARSKIYYASLVWVSKSGQPWPGLLWTKGLWTENISGHLKIFGSWPLKYGVFTRCRPSHLPHPSGSIPYNSDSI